MRLNGENSLFYIDCIILFHHKSGDTLNPGGVASSERAGIPIHDHHPHEHATIVGVQFLTWRFTRAVVVFERRTQTL